MNRSAAARRAGALGAAVIACAVASIGSIAEVASAQRNICIPTSFISEWCPVHETEAAVQSAAAPVHDAVEQRLAPANGPLYDTANRAEGPYSGTTGCAHIAMDAAGSALGHGRDSSNTGCLRNDTDTTYYAGSPGSYSVVSYAGTSNGHVLRVTENSIRSGEPACIDTWVVLKGGGRRERSGVCAMERGVLHFDGGYDYVASSWCAAHPAGSEGDYHEDALGRCRYTFVRR